MSEIIVFIVVTCLAAFVIAGVVIIAVGVVSL